MDKDSDEVANSLTISEIDLLKQQLYGCWIVPAGVKVGEDMGVKVRAVLNPACNSLKLPPDKYEILKKFIFKFELEWMLGN